jgi:hypothetical protein
MERQASSVEGGRVSCFGIPQHRRTPELRSRVLLSGDAEAREEKYRRVALTRGLKQWSKFESTKRTELRFRAVLTEGRAERLELSRG